jgi:hypothetical protein
MRNICLSNLIFLSICAKYEKNLQNAAYIVPNCKLKVCLRCLFKHVNMRGTSGNKGV